MTATVVHVWRLLKWGRILARHGALLGIERDPLAHRTELPDPRHDLAPEQARALAAVRRRGGGGGRVVKVCRRRGVV